MGPGRLQTFFKTRPNVIRCTWSRTGSSMIANLPQTRFAFRNHEQIPRGTACRQRCRCSNSREPASGDTCRAEHLYLRRKGEIIDAKHICFTNVQSRRITQPVTAIGQPCRCASLPDPTRLARSKIASLEPQKYSSRRMHTSSSQQHNIELHTKQSARGLCNDSVNVDGCFEVYSRLALLIFLQGSHVGMTSSTILSAKLSCRY